MKHLTWVAIALFVAACSNGTEAPPAASPTAGGPTLTVEGRAFGQAPQLAAGESMNPRDSIHEKRKERRLVFEVAVKGHARLQSSGEPARCPVTTRCRLLS